jgi:SAM-dependent methyltransferase
MAAADVTRDPTQRFSSRVENYVRYRPAYPQAAIDLLRSRCGLGAGSSVADLGSGTGILSRMLLACGAQVFAVEPNDAMRAAAEYALSSEPRFHSIRGSAEATTLAACSVGLIVAGQAFHWFRVAEARREALRIAQPGACGALLWNERPPDADGFLGEYEALVRSHSPEYDQVVGSRAREQDMREFLGGRMELASFPNQQVFDFAGVVGRLMSSSYAPEPGDPAHAPLLSQLREVFERHAHEGRIVFPYVTLVYYGSLASAL